MVAAATCAVSATDAWADDAARIGNGGPLRIAMPGTAALQTLLLTEDLDPDGRWLMAAAVADQRDEAAKRVAWLDLSRYDRVLGDHLSTTPADLSGDIDALRAAPPVAFATGDRIQVTGTPAVVTVDYLDDEGVVSSLLVTLDRSGLGSVPVDDCARSCVYLGVSAPEVIEVTGIRLGGDDLLAGPLTLKAGQVTRPEEGGAPEPMLLAGSIEATDTTVDGIGGEPRPLEVVGESRGGPTRCRVPDCSVTCGSGSPRPAGRCRPSTAWCWPAPTPRRTSSTGWRRPGARSRVTGSRPTAGSATVSWPRSGSAASPRSPPRARAARPARRAAQASRALGRERAAFRLLGVGGPVRRTARLVELVLLALLVTGRPGWPDGCRPPSWPTAWTSSSPVRPTCRSATCSRSGG